MAPAVLERILIQFRQDPIYLLDMLQHAALISYKEAIWQARAEAEKTIKDAKTSCLRDRTELCHVGSPCGFGACKYASASNAQLVIESNGSSQRAAQVSRGGFATQDAVEYVTLRRNIRKPPAFSAGASRRNTE